MDAKRIESLVWVLIYGGLLTASVGGFVVHAGGDALGLTMLAIGLLVAAAGAALIVVRARMDDESPRRR